MTSTASYARLSSLGAATIVYGSVRLRSVSTVRVLNSTNGERSRPIFGRVITIHF